VQWKYATLLGTPDWFLGMPSETNGLSQGAEKGGQLAASRLMPVVYTELRRIAGHYRRRETPGKTLQPTALVHEAYMRLLGQGKIGWRSRDHFIAIAAIAMRRILVERARRRSAKKRDGEEKWKSLDELAVLAPEKSSQLLALDEALKRLATLSPRQGRIVELRFFAGLNIDEIAVLEGLSTRTIKNDWSVARAWLHREIARSD
jgi:RNA polymerase sigma-70 factor, ECF subfamily